MPQVGTAVIIAGGQGDPRPERHGQDVGTLPRIGQGGDALMGGDIPQIGAAGLAGHDVGERSGDNSGNGCGKRGRKGLEPRNGGASHAASSCSFVQAGNAEVPIAINRQPGFPVGADPHGGHSMYICRRLIQRKHIVQLARFRFAGRHDSRDAAGRPVGIARVQRPARSGGIRAASLAEPSQRVRRLRGRQSAGH